MIIKNILYTLSLLLFVGCHYRAGPDKQGGGMLQGALTGAGTGAVTGIQLSSTTGPGMMVGAGVGGLAGAIQGAMVDSLEEEQRILTRRIIKERGLAEAHALLAEHYQRRLELHPTRDIYPADYFFFGDEAKLKNESIVLVDEVARLNKERLPFSRIVVTVYSKAKSKDGIEGTEYAYSLGEERAKAIANRFIHTGLSPRRIEARAMVVDSPLLIDPKDEDPTRYSQAIEITPVDR